MDQHISHRGAIRAIRFEHSDSQRCAIPSFLALIQVEDNVYLNQ